MTPRSPTDRRGGNITDAHGWDFSRIGYSCASKGKSVETEHVMFTFALTGRGVIGCGGLPRVSLRLPWAMEAIGLSARLGLTGLCAFLDFSPPWVDRDEQNVTRS